jgi:hypothetical protein
MASRLGWLVPVVAISGFAPACIDVPTTLTRLMEAQRLASALHLSFTHSVEAANRAIMATDDEAAARAASESREAVAAIERQLLELRQILQSLAFRTDLERLDAFKVRYDEYRRLNEDTLRLVLENTNVMAQRLAYGPSAEAADAFHQAVEAAVKQAPASGRCAAREHAARAWASVLELRVLYPRHIAEADDEAMTRLEAQMTEAAGRAHSALGQLIRELPQSSGPLGDAKSALDRFMTTHPEIVELSRRNSNVRALDLTLGRKRVLAVDAEVQLEALEKGLAEHGFKATR